MCGLRGFAEATLRPVLWFCRRLMESLAASVPGVANAFFVLLLVMAIFAILGVQVGADLTLLT